MYVLSTKCFYFPPKVLLSVTFVGLLKDWKLAVSTNTCSGKYTLDN